MASMPKPPSLDFLSSSFLLIGESDWDGTVSDTDSDEVGVAGEDGLGVEVVWVSSEGVAPGSVVEDVVGSIVAVEGVVSGPPLQGVVSMV